jgi:hypothetical protein
MRNADTVLGVIRERGRRRLPLEDIYRQLYNRDLYLRGYGRIYRNDGAMTSGATPETVDAMSLEKIDAIIGLLRQERYRWTPVRRTYIPKKTGKLRPLGIPTWSDKRKRPLKSRVDGRGRIPLGHPHRGRPTRGQPT